MQLGSVYSENKRRKTLNWFLHAIGMSILFLTFTSFTPISSIAGITPTSDILRQTTLQSPSSDFSEKEYPFLVGLEVEEVEESKEEKKDGSSDTFSFYSSTSILANEHCFLEEAFLSENCTVSLVKLPLYLLFQNLRIHLS